MLGTEYLHTCTRSFFDHACNNFLLCFDNSIPANFFWDISVRFFSWDWRRHDHFRRFPKKSEVVRRSRKSSEDVRRLPKAKSLRKRLSTKSEITRKVLSFIHFTHGFRSLHGSELTYFWKLCQARRQQLTFFNQAWEIGQQAWAGMRSKFSTRRHESWQVYDSFSSKCCLQDRIKLMCGWWLAAMLRKIRDFPKPVCKINKNVNFSFN